MGREATRLPQRAGKYGIAFFVGAVRAAVLVLMCELKGGAGSMEGAL